MEAEKRNGILLDSGTNEVEIMEFFLSGQSFGVNVAKVKQIIQFDETLIIHIPHSNPAALGAYLFRDETIPMIDLKKALDFQETQVEKPLALVTEFNSLVNAFLIDGVNRIHRVSWKEIKPMNAMLEGFVSSFTGSVNIENREILIVDLEQLVAEVDPESQLKQLEENDEEEFQKKHGIKIVIAEDSTYMRNTLFKSLKTLGFNVIETFDNGQSAYDYIVSLKEKAVSEGKSVREYLDMLITDIEMPQMDGLTLCKQLKEQPELSKLQVAVFSSLINKQLEEKCKKVGVDYYAAKPKLEELNKIIIDCCSAS
jgi:two-component system chemotaxis response regulator CheV